MGYLTPNVPQTAPSPPKAGRGEEQFAAWS
jgi:hypothetical protein